MHRPFCDFFFQHRNTGIRRFQYLGIGRIIGGGGVGGAGGISGMNLVDAGPPHTHPINVYWSMEKVYL